MADNMEKIGLEAVMDDDSFTAAMAEYNAAMSNALKNTESFTSGSNKLWEESTKQIETALAEIDTAMGESMETAKSWGGAWSQTGQDLRDVLAAMDVLAESGTPLVTPKGASWDETKKAVQDAIAKMDEAKEEEAETTEEVAERDEEATSKINAAWAAVVGGVAGAVSSILVTIGTKLVEGVIRAAITIVKTVLDMAAKVTKAIAGMVQDFVSGAFKLGQAAAEIPGIAASFYSLADAVGVSGTEMLKMLKESSAGMMTTLSLMKEFNQTATYATSSVAKKLPEALQFLGKVAYSTGQDLDSLLSSFVLGVSRLQTRYLRNLGIITDLTTAYKQWADENNRTVESMNKEEQQIAVLNIALKQLAQNTANIPDIMGTAMQRTAAYTTSLQNLKDMAGLFFVPAVAEMYGALGDFISKVQDAIIEGGKLHDILVNVGAAFLLISEYISKFLNQYGLRVVEVLAELGAKLFVSGAEIVLQLAKGMMSVLPSIVAAIAAIGKAITYWLEAHSAPRLLPDLVAWGKSAAEAWLYGMTTADFDILQSLGGYIQQVFSIFADLGRMAEAQVGPAFVELSQMIAQSLAETGTIGQEVFDALIAATGEFGAALANLLAQELALRDATLAVKRAQEELNEAKKAEERASVKVTKLTRDYNTLLKTGASKDVLKAKLAEINAAERQREQAKQQKTAAEEALETSQKQLSLMQEQVSLQRALVAQMITWAQAMVPKEDMTAGIEEALSGIGVGLGEDFISGLLDEIETRKGEMEGAFEDLFAPVLDFFKPKTIELGHFIPGPGGIDIWVVDAIAEGPSAFEEMLSSLESMSAIDFSGFSDTMADTLDSVSKMMDEFELMGPKIDELTGKILVWIERLEKAYNWIASIIDKIKGSTGEADIIQYYLDQEQKKSSDDLPMIMKDETASVSQVQNYHESSSMVRSPVININNSFPGMVVASDIDIEVLAARVSAVQTMKLRTSMVG